MSSDEQLNAYLAKISGMITQYGWIVQGVFPTSEDQGPGFAYTVGMTPAGLPELVISGIFSEQAQQLLNIAAKQHCQKRIKPGATLTEIANVPFRVIDAPRAEINMARNLYGHEPGAVTAVQLVWPDENGLWPGSPFYKSEPKQELFGAPWWFGYMSKKGYKPKSK